MSTDFKCPQIFLWSELAADGSPALWLVLRWSVSVGVCVDHGAWYYVITQVTQEVYLRRRWNRRTGKYPECTALLNIITGLRVHVSLEMFPRQIKFQCHISLTLHFALCRKPDNTDDFSGSHVKGVQSPPLNHNLPTGWHFPVLSLHCRYF